ncbi:tRNA-guanine(15) transglycosylase-like protein [Cyathus striatus]|nr:tRNA-guanine(15) transglycosylase-like protein [Cyathus striatus]
MATLPSVPVLQFSLLNPTSSLKFGPRIGTVVLKRPGTENHITISTPGLLTTTSRGLIPHLSKDNIRLTEAIRWVGVPFETFCLSSDRCLEQDTPVPTLYPGPNPLHTFLGFTPGQHVVALSARDPTEGKEMPTNSHTHICVSTLRGIRKLSPEQWRSYVHATKPDVVVSLSDTPFINPPYSQKRLTKSIERSAAWLVDLLRPSPPSSISSSSPLSNQDLFIPPPVLLPLAGLTSSRARAAFSETLMEPLYGPEKVALQPRSLACLDEGVSGYVLDLVPLRIALSASQSPNTEIPELLKASLAPLPETKLRLATVPKTPHEMLHLINEVGIDLFDAHWAQEAASNGVALDFTFPAPSLPPIDTSGKKNHLGHNLYSTFYRQDFSSLSTSAPACPCAACAPQRRTRIFHGVDKPSDTGEQAPVAESKPGFTRAYIHHLLHTHEMSAHSLLAMHNLTVLDAFFAGVREVLAKGDTEAWKNQIKHFEETYDETFAVLREAGDSWKEVDLARGKGRLAREKEKEKSEANNSKKPKSPLPAQVLDASMAKGMESMAFGEPEAVVDAVDREVPLKERRVTEELAEKGVEK